MATGPVQLLVVDVGGAEPTGEVLAELQRLAEHDIVRLLDLKPHPEGGHFRETFRDRKSVV